MGKSRRPVVAYHIILTCYGFWLPNDPRGSGSKCVWSEALREFGPATYTESRRSVARRPHDFTLRRLAKSALKYPPVQFDGHQALAVAHGFRDCLKRAGVDCFACAVMPDHAHLVVARGALSAEELMIDLKAASAHELLQTGQHSFQETVEKRPKIWARSGRKMFLFDHEDLWRSINYTNANPTFDGLPRQRWSFVKPYPARG